MISNEVAVLFMAGGTSSRFGDDDKLLAPLDGEVLAAHMARRLTDLTWARRLAVAHDSLRPLLEALGYEVVPPSPGNGLGDNLALAAQSLTNEAGALIVLADMPFVTAAHVIVILAAASSAKSVVCTRTTSVISPPVLIGRDHFDALRQLTGDQGARSIIAAAGPHVAMIDAAPALTADIDTAEDLDAWRLQGGRADQ